MIRDAKVGDADTIAEIYNYYIRNTVVTFEEQELSASDMAWRMEKVSSTGFPWLIAEKDANILGYAYATKWHERSAYRYTAEVTVYISHKTTSQGWGTMLYNELFDRLELLQMHSVIGGITLPNEASVALHEKFGLLKSAHYKEVGQKFGQWLDVGYWQKILANTGRNHNADHHATCKNQERNA